MSLQCNSQTNKDTEDYYVNKTLQTPLMSIKHTHTNSLHYFVERKWSMFHPNVLGDKLPLDGKTIASRILVTVSLSSQ